MKKLILFELVLFACIVAGAWSGLISWTRASQAFLGLGVIDLVIGLFALLGWQIIRGDVSNAAPLSRRDTGEMHPRGHISASYLPSPGFIIQVIVVGMIAIALGIILAEIYI